MPQYDAGPGDWSDRPWEDPEKKPEPHARRSRRFSLPPWALLVIIVGIVIVLCVSLVLIVRAIRGGGDAIPTPEATFTAVIIPTATQAAAPEPVESPTPTVDIPPQGTVPPTAVVGIGPGATVVVQGTGGTGLNIRQQPTTYGKVVASAKEGQELEVLEGPHEADGHVWWKVKTADGDEGWGAGDWLVLKEE
ncbi:MAG: SH3 domain-containing protein [Anaerolineae bacterium]